MAPDEFEFEGEELPDAVREAFWNYPRIKPGPDFNQRLMASHRQSKHRDYAEWKAASSWVRWLPNLARNRIAGAALCGAVTGYLLLSLILHYLGIGSVVSPARTWSAGAGLMSASGDRVGDWPPASGRGGP